MSNQDGNYYENFHIYILDVYWLFGVSRLSIRALLECDSNGRVLLSWFDMAQSENAKLKFQLDSMGNLLADFKVPSDTVYISGKDSTIIKAEVKYIEVERKINAWEKFCIGFTIIALLSIIAFVILKLRSIIKF